MVAAGCDAAGFVLAGGRSSRMGADKALADFCGKPLVAHAIGCLREAGLPVAIAGARAGLSAFAPVIPDKEADRGPLGGICAALEQCGTPIAVFVSVDMPLLPSSAIAFLAAHAQKTGRTATLFSVNGFSQSFPAAIRAEALPALQAEMERGAGGCFAAFHAAAQARGEQIAVLPVEVLVQTGHIADPRGLPAFRWWTNVNTPNDLARAAAYAASVIA